MPRYPFIDPVVHREVTLVVNSDITASGVEHPDCDRLADVSPEMDAFYCTQCSWNGRISGAWFVDMFHKANDGGSQ